VWVVEGTQEADLAESGLGETLIVIAAGDADLPRGKGVRDEFVVDSHSNCVREGQQRAVDSHLLDGHLLA